MTMPAPLSRVISGAGRHLARRGGDAGDAEGPRGVPDLSIAVLMVATVVMTVATTSYLRCRARLGRGSRRCSARAPARWRR